MADPNERTVATDPVQAKRARDEGLGQSQQAMDAEQRSFEGEAPEAERRRDGWGLDPNLGRDEAGLGDVAGDLGAGTPANVALQKLGQGDRPQEDWGEAAGEGATYSANHTRRPDKSEAERGQGAKTRTANKNQVSRRS